MEASRKWHGIGVLSLAALIVLVMALSAGAQAAGGFKNCGTKKIVIQIEDGTGGTRPYAAHAAAIMTKNVTCAAAVEFLKLAYSGEKVSSTGFPQNYKCKGAEFKVPDGYLPTICTKGSKTIKYGAQGG